MNDISKITERLSPTNHWEASLYVTLLHELTQGSPVTIERLAKKLGWSEQQVATVLDQLPCGNIEYDSQGRLIGYGVTLRETPHSFQVNGRQLYTWCALDALMFPAVIDKTAHVRSHCPHTNEAIILTVMPREVLAIQPAGATVSLVPVAEKSDIRSGFCCHVNFFSSRQAGESWRLKTPGVEIVSVSEAFCLGQNIAHQLIRDVEALRYDGA